MYKKKSEKAASGPEKPLRNRRQEQFCHIYACELWGRPAEAAEKAGYRPGQKTGISWYEPRRWRIRRRMENCRL